MLSNPLIRGAILALALGGLEGEGLRAADVFTRGDADESGRIDVSDAVAILLGLFSGDGARLRCEAAADADDDDVIALADAIYILRALFQGGPAPPAPFPDCGIDATGGPLACETYEGCGSRFTFAVRPYAADGVYFVVDRSAYMAGSGELNGIKGEMQRVVADDMSEGTESAFIFFDSGTVRFPATSDPWVVMKSTKPMAIEFISRVPGGDDRTCPVQAFSSAFESMARGHARRNIVFFVHASEGTCTGGDEATYIEESLEAITRMNGGTARIHTFSVHPIGPERREFLKRLAESNGGAYTALWDSAIADG